MSPTPPLSPEQESEAEEQDLLHFMHHYPFVVVHVNMVDGAWTIKAHPTMKEALLDPRMPHCKTPTVFGSWGDYFEWKNLRLTENQRP